MDVAVIGGGIVGLASAYELGERGVDVTVLEKDTLGAGSTGRSGGGIRSQFSTPVNVRLSQASKRVWEDFEARFGVDIRHRRIGYLFLAREEATADRLREDVAMQNDLGVESEFLTPAEARERCPELYAEEYVGAAYNGDDGFVDPYLSLQGYAEAVRERGVDIRTGTRVTDVLKGGDRVTGVATDDGRVEADIVVNAAGPWAGRVAAMAGLDLPITPELHRIAFVRPDPPMPASVPLTIDLDGGVVFRPEEDDVVAVGGHVDDHPEADPDDFPEDIGLGWTGAVLERLAGMCGYFDQDSTVTDGLTGLYAMTPDTNPVIEETRPGFINAVGFSGHGFMHAPATGQLVAELACDGEASLVDVSALSSDRFDHSVAEERHFI